MTFNFSNYSPKNTSAEKGFTPTPKLFGVSLRSKRGFTLIEVLVVTAIIGLMSSFLISNFSKTRLDLFETTSMVTGDIRAVQAKAAASSKYKNQIRCGYGIHYVSPTSYILFAGPATGPTVDCTTKDKIYDATDPTEYITVDTKNLFDSRVEIKNIGPDNGFKDIFFEPPNPKSYINGFSGLTLSQAIVIGKKNVACSATDCKTICVYNSGKIETLNGSQTCP